jgi:hypothetical protein
MGGSRRAVVKKKLDRPPLAYGGFERAARATTVARSESNHVQSIFLEIGLRSEKRMTKVDGGKAR